MAILICLQANASFRSCSSAWGLFIQISSWHLHLEILFRDVLDLLANESLLSSLPSDLFPDHISSQFFFTWCHWELEIDHDRHVCIREINNGCGVISEKQIINVSLVISISNQACLSGIFILLQKVFCFFLSLSLSMVLSLGYLDPIAHWYVSLVLISDY